MEKLRNIRLGLQKLPRNILWYYTFGWYFPNDEKSKDRRNLFFVNQTSNIVGNLIGGTFLTGLLLYMNATDGFIGMMTLIMFAANMFQIASPLLLERIPQRKKLLLICHAALTLINVVIIGLIPLFPASGQLRLALVAAMILLANLLGAVFGPGFTVWFISFIPDDMRARFFSTVNIFNGIVVTGAVIGAGFLVDHFKAGGNELLGLQVIRGIAFIFAIIDFILIMGIKEYPYEKTDGVKLKQLLVDPFRERIYLRTVAIAFIWSLSANITGPYYTIYLLDNLNISYSFLMLMNIISVPLLIFFTPLWERYLRRSSWFMMLTVSMGVFLLHYLILPFVTVKNVYFLFPSAILLSSVFAVGINLAFANIPYINIPKINKTLFIGFYTAVSHLGALIGISIGNGFIFITEGIDIVIFNTNMGNKQLLMIFAAVIMLISVVLVNALRKGTEPVSA